MSCSRASLLKPLLALLREYKVRMVSAWLGPPSLPFSNYQIMCRCSWLCETRLRWHALILMKIVKVWISSDRSLSICKKVKAHPYSLWWVDGSKQVRLGDGLTIRKATWASRLAKRWGRTSLRKSIYQILRLITNSKGHFHQNKISWSRIEPFLCWQPNWINLSMMS